MQSQNCKIGYEFKEAAFFNYLFKEEIDDEFVKLFEQYQIFKYLPDFTKYTDKGVDNKTHFGEHYCCLIKSLIEQGYDYSVLLDARTCITGLFVPKSALKEFCDIARIKIKLYWYENDTKQGKKLNNQNMWDKIRKISMTVNLTNPKNYAGGNLKFDFGHHNAKRFHVCQEIRPTGSIIIFPSYTHHCVTPVTRGTRYSLVLWSLGKPWR